MFCAEILCMRSKAMMVQIFVFKSFEFFFRLVLNIVGTQGWCSAKSPWYSFRGMQCRLSEATSIHIRMLTTASNSSYLQRLYLDSIDTCVSTCTHMHTHTNIHTYICTHAHKKYIYTYMCTCTHTCTIHLLEII